MLLNIVHYFLWLKFVKTGASSMLDRCGSPHFFLCGWGNIIKFVRY